MAEEMPALAGRRVLIVEDEFLLADDLTDGLTRAGATVIGPAATARDALDLIAAGGIDAAMLDLNLRDHFAFDVADALREAGTPFCLVTGYDEAAIPERLRDAPRCPKPSSMSAMLAMLESQLAKPVLSPVSA